MTVEDGLGGSSSDKRDKPLRWMPFARGTFEKPPSRDTLAHEQLLPEVRESVGEVSTSTPLPEEIMRTINEMRSPT